MLFNLVVGEAEYLHSIGECRLGRAYFGKEVDDFLVAWEHLLDVVVREVNDAVAVIPDDAAHVVGEDDFSFTRLVEALDFIVMGDYLLP